MKNLTNNHTGTLHCLFNLKALFLGSICFMSTNAFAQAHYVNAAAPPGQDGSSWELASNDLQAMINTAGQGEEIWVAKGTYKPNRRAAALDIIIPNDRDNAFVLKEGVKIYGGFIGTEVYLEERNIEANPTILSGDLGEEDIATDNAYHVVISAGYTAFMGNKTILDGFTILNGNADTDVYETAIEVVYINGIGTSRLNGGGIYIASSSPSLTNVFISENAASYGGGIYTGVNASPVLKNISILNNSATNFGGGMFNDSSAPFIVSTRIGENTAIKGGGIYNIGASAIITSSLINGNISNDGGGVYNYQASPVFTNVTITNNKTPGPGAAMSNYESAPVVRNTIIYGNNSGVENYSSTPDYAYSLVQDVAGGTNGNLNSDMDSLFTDADNNNYSLPADSPCINAGNNSFYVIGETPELSDIEDDLDIADRFQGAAVDMGAFEYLFNCAITTTWNGTEWDNGVPTSNEYAAVIAGDYTSSGNIKACSLTVLQGTATLLAGHTFYINDAITVNPEATFIVKNNAALVQMRSVANTGKIILTKNSNLLYRLDYTMWSSPVTGQELLAFSTLTNATRFYEYKYDTDPVSQLPVEQYFGITPAGNYFTAGKGYLIRMPNIDATPGYNTGTAPIVYAGTFTGTPHNGTIAIPASTEGGRYTAVGNPYPSPISVADFFTRNSGIIDTNSAIYFWRKRNNAAVSSYASLTLAGFTANGASGTAGYTAGGQDQADFYTTDNATWLIAQGQGFIVQTKDTIGTANIVFTNSMRRAAPGAQAFFKSAGSSVSRLWLNLSGNNGFSQAAIAYMENGTLGIDYGYDGKQFTDGGSVALFSLAANTNLAIQARPAFEASDVVPMGFVANDAGSYTIGLDHFDGLFTGSQNIYLKDKQEGIIHNLKNSDYTFVTTTGTFTNRFEVVYTTSALNTNNPVLSTDSVIVYKEGAAIKINSGSVLMTDVNIYDIRGRKLYTQATINAAQTAITGLNAAQEMLIVEVSTAKGKVSKRLVY